MDIYEIDKNTIEKIKISLNEFRGSSFVDIRIFYNFSENEIPDFRPTRKGITIPMDLAQELKEGIDKALVKHELGDL